MYTSTWAVPCISFISSVWATFHSHTHGLAHTLGMGNHSRLLHESHFRVYLANHMRHCCECSFYQDMKCVLFSTVYKYQICFISRAYGMQTDKYDLSQNIRTFTSIVYWMKTTFPWVYKYALKCVENTTCPIWNIFTSWKSAAHGKCGYGSLAEW
jgi:hypothetical protein